MRKLFLALSASAILVGGAVASSLDDSTVNNSVGMESSSVTQQGYKNAANLGTEIQGSAINDSELNNNVYMKNSSIYQRGSENYVNTGTKVGE